jgi:hypothetical protein
MRICFDFEFLEKDAKSKCSAEEQAALQEMDDKIYQAVNMYEEEIDAEEAKNKDAVIMVYLLTNPKAIEPKNYSRQLKDKILSTMGDDFVKKLWESVEDALLRFSK